jgi:hypothetical protein
MGESDAEDFEPPSEETAAKTLRARAVCSEPHRGHLAGSLEDIERTSFSNLLPQDLQAYS